MRATLEDADSPALFSARTRYDRTDPRGTPASLYSVPVVGVAKRCHLAVPVRRSTATFEAWPCISHRSFTPAPDCSARSPLGASGRTGQSKYEASAIAM